jgi:S-layer protein (TIGR01567 family)
VLSDQPDANGNRGIVYTTQAQPKFFKFKSWGEYQIIGFLGEAYFAAYDNIVTPFMADAGINVAFLYDISKNRNLMTKAQLSRVLIDDNKEQVIKKGGSLMLKEGYELTLKGIDDKGHVYVELLKNGQSIDTKVINPSVDNAVMVDKTYYYKTDIGDVKEIVTIAIHFKNSYRDEEQAFATADGIWQISDTPISINPGKQYDKMSIRNVDPSAMTINMDNKDNAIALSKNKNITLMQNIYLRTADQDVIDEANPLRYYIYTLVTIEPETINETASATGSTVPENETTATNPERPPQRLWMRGYDGKLEE